MTVPRHTAIRDRNELSDARQSHRSPDHTPAFAGVDQHLGDSPVSAQDGAVDADPLQGVLALRRSDTERIEISSLVGNRRIEPANVTLHPVDATGAERAVTIEQQNRQRHTHAVTVPITG